jgi:hypothetical protein
MDARGITEALGGRWQGHYGLCRCPAHGDKTPSLKIRDDHHRADGIDLVCFAGCGWQEVKTALQRQGLLVDFRSETPRWSRTAEVVEVLGKIPSPGIEATSDQRKALALKIWQASAPLPDTHH